MEFGPSRWDPVAAALRPKGMFNGGGGAAKEEYAEDDEPAIGYPKAGTESRDAVPAAEEKEEERRNEREGENEG